MPLDQGYIFAIKYWILIHIFIYDYSIYTLYLLNYTCDLAIKKIHKNGIPSKRSIQGSVELVEAHRMVYKKTKFHRTLMS